MRVEGRDEYIAVFCYFNRFAVIAERAASLAAVEYLMSAVAFGTAYCSLIFRSAYSRKVYGERFYLFNEWIGMLIYF